MLPPYIIEEIRKREKGAEERDRPAIPLPLPMEDLPPRAPERKRDDDDGRGVVIIELFPDQQE